METMVLAGEEQIKNWLREIVKAAIAQYFEASQVNAPTNEPLISRKAAAALLEISTATLNTWMNEGLPAYKQKGRVYHLESEIRDFVLKKKKMR